MLRTDNPQLRGVEIATPNRTAFEDPALTARLADLLRATWRSLIRATRAAEHLPTIPEPQVLALRQLLDARLTPAELAVELGVARSTVSSLVKDLEADGLVRRRRTATDGRSVTLVPTARAKKVLDRFSSGRVEVLTSALGSLPLADQRRLASALPSLALLLERLEALASAAEQEARGPRRTSER